MDPAPAPLRALPDARFSCDGKGTCCSGWRFGPLSEEDRGKILAHDWAGFVPGAATPGALLSQELASERWNLAMRGERCAFLLDDGRCGIHARLGAAEKPHVCRMYPFTVASTPEGRFVGVRGECSCRGRSRASGPLVSEQLDAIAALAREGPSGSFTVGARTPWTAAIEVPFALAAAVREAALAALEAPGGASLEERLAAVRDLACGVALALGERPGPAEVAAALEAARDLARARALRPAEAYPGAASAPARAALISLLEEIAGWLARYLLALAPGARVARAAAEECLVAIYHLLEQIGPPARYAPVFGDGGTIGVDFGAPPDAPGPRAFLDDLRNELFGWTLNGYPMLQGLGVSLLQYVILKCAARLRAARRGARAVEAEDVEEPLVALKLTSRESAWRRIVEGDPARLEALLAGWRFGSRSC